MAWYVKEQKQFCFFPECLEAVNVTFQQTYTPLADFNKCMAYYSKKHKDQSLCAAQWAGESLLRY